MTKGNAGITTLLLILLASLCAPGLAADTGPASYQEGARIEVRQGDGWSAATYVRKEGRRHLIRHSDGSEQWLSAEAIRQVAATGAAGAPATTAESEKPGAGAFSVADAVDIRHPRGWKQAKVTRTAGDWVMVEMDWPIAYYWIESWAVRRSGSTYDFELPTDYEMRRSPTKADAAPPSKPAGQPPARPSGDSRFVSFQVNVPDVGVKNARELAMASAAPLALKRVAAPPETLILPLRLRKPRPDYITVLRCHDSPSTAVVAAQIMYDDTIEVFRVDLTSTSTSRDQPTSGTFSGRETLQDAADQGRLLLTLPKDRSSQARQVIVRKLDGQTYYPAFVLGGIYGKGADIQLAQFLDSERILVDDRNGTMYVISLAERRATHRLKHIGSSKPFFHPSGKLAAYVNDKKELEVVSLQGEPSVLARIPGAHIGATMAFTPDGTKVVHWEGKTLRIYRIADGTLVREQPLAMMDSRSLEMLDDTMALADTFLVNVTTGATLWRYQTIDALGHSRLLDNGMMAWGFARNQEIRLVATVLPDSLAARAMQSKFAQMPVLPGAIPVFGVSDVNATGITGTKR